MHLYQTIQVDILRVVGEAANRIICCKQYFSTVGVDSLVPVVFKHPSNVTYLNFVKFCAVKLRKITSLKHSTRRVLGCAGRMHF